MRQIRVMLVDDSPVYLGMMQAAVKQDTLLCLVGCYSDGIKALNDVPTNLPDVVVCDAHMASISGVEFIKKISKTHRVPVVMVSRDEMVAREGLAAGAVAFVPKLSSMPLGHVRFSKQVVESIHIAAKPRAKTLDVFSEVQKPQTKPALAFNKQSNGVVAIGASTGGTDATLAVVRDLPADFPATLITQHMPVGFTSLYAARLQRECAMQVSEAVDGMRLKQGLMILAAGDHHLSLHKDENGYFIHSKSGAKVSGHVPSVDVLFHSVAKEAKKNAIGVLLTGMGADGAAGLLSMRRAGAFTYGQDEKTCIVYGMPKVAFEMGAVARQLPLFDIGADLLREAYTRLN